MFRLLSEMFFYDTCLEIENVRQLTHRSVKTQGNQESQPGKKNKEKNKDNFYIYFSSYFFF